MMEPVAAKAHELPWQEQEAAELRAELHLMKTAGIIEVAVRNPSVAEYMAHWEARAEAAEALLKEARKVLEPFSDDEVVATWTDDSGWTDVAPKNDRICDWFGPSDFRAARSLMSKIGERNGEA